MLVICWVSHVSQPLTAQTYAFVLNQSRSFRENMDPSVALDALAFSACFAAITRESHPQLDIVPASNSAQRTVMMCTSDVFP